MPDSKDDQVPFSSHLDELRKRLLWSIFGIGVAFLVVFGWFADDIVRYVKGIAIVDHDIAATEYADFQTAVEMPFRAAGSTWTLRIQHGDATTFAHYEVLSADATGAEVKRTVTGDSQDDSITFTHTFDGEPAPGAEALLLGEETITVPAGEFECFKRTVTEGKTVNRTWVAKTGGVLVRNEVSRSDSKTVTELTEYDLKPFSEQIRFTVIATLETFSTTMRVSLYAALIFAYPWVMLQAYFFIAPGLYRHERQFFRVAIPSIFLLFVAGAAFGRYVLLPISIPFLLGFNVTDFDVDTNYSLAQFLALVFAMTFGLGFIFQIPLIVAPLIRFGLVSPEFFKSKRRYTILIAVVIGAIVSPSGSPIDMLLAGLPVFFLVEGGVWAGRLWKFRVLKRAEKRAVEAAKRGEKIDPEELAGGLAFDLEKKLKDFAGGGAREFAKELMSGLKGSGKDLESIFDDDYKDDDKPPVEVKLKPRPKKPDAAETPGQPAPEFKEETQTASPEPAATPAAVAATPDNEDEYPDRPWDENVNEDVARYIEDRITQRLEQFFERELRPWMDRIEHELKDR
ncbi:MAG: twin-arginine translocase subunit TatC [Planctomycetes bacterium]|nr:twin-arginine translocase subunit TatC [Planctomycetota bacterium]